MGVGARAFPFVNVRHLKVNWLVSSSISYLMNSLANPGTCMTVSVT